MTILRRGLRDWHMPRGRCHFNRQEPTSGDGGLDRPVTTGDTLRSDHDGRVELQLDRSLIRLSNDTGSHS